MPYNLFIIPIITGYLILTNSSLLKYNSQRLTRVRILFESIVIGITSLGVGFFIRGLVELIPFDIIKSIYNFLDFIPFREPNYFWTILFSCFLASILFIVIEQYIKKYYSKDDAIVWAINKNGDELETLVKDSALKGQTIMLTLKNNKVYIGFSEEIPIPQKTNYLKLSPILSGYRDSETKEFKPTTDYFKVVDKFINEIEEKEGIKKDKITLNTDIIIKQDEILTASIYEQSIYNKFNKTSTEPAPIQVTT